MKLSDKLRQDNDSGDFGGALEGYAEEAEKLENSAPKIKMTKAIPTDGGWHYFAGSPKGAICFSYVFMRAGGTMAAHHDDLLYCRDIGGYWAKVDPSQFEFED